MQLLHVPAGVLVHLVTMSPITKVYAGRLAGMVVRGPDTEVIGRVRDVVVIVRPNGHVTRALGLVVEVVNNRRIFLPMLRVASIEPQEIMLVSGSVSLRAFKPRTGELTIVGDLVGSKVQVDDPELENLHGRPVEIADIELERTRTRDWIVSRVAVFGEKPKFGRRGSLHVVPWSHVHGITAAGAGQSDKVAELIARFDNMRPADIASLLRAMPAAERQTVAEQLDDERLADILQELPDDRQA